MNIKKYLSSYELLKIEYIRLKDIYNKLDEEIIELNGAINYTGMPHGSNISKPTEEVAVRLADAKLEYIEKFNETIETMLNIERMIGTLSNAKQRYVLHERYINLRPLSQIAYDDIVDRSERQVRNYHDAAILELKERYENG